MILTVAFVLALMQRSTQTITLEAYLAGHCGHTTQPVLQLVLPPGIWQENGMSCVALPQYGSRAKICGEFKLVEYLNNPPPKSDPPVDHWLAPWGTIR